LAGDQAFLIYPYLWAEGAPIEERGRKAAPMAEVFELQFDVLRQMAAGGGT